MPMPGQAIGKPVMPREIGGNGRVQERRRSG
jgi:hypothetical protein